MGVKRLFQVVKFFANDCMEENSFKDYRGTVQALDASIIIYKFCIALLNTEHYKKKDGEVVERFTGLSSKVSYVNAINESLK